MKEINAYLNFDGNCREAMQFYQKCLGAELMLLPLSQMPGANVPKGAENRIMHARLTKGTATLMASDTMPGMPLQAGDNFSVTVSCDSAEETERIFNALGEKGKVTMPLQETFWAIRFGMLTDQFGVKWMLNFEKPQN